MVSETVFSFYFEALKEDFLENINKNISSQIAFGYGGISLLPEDEKLPFYDAESQFTITCDVRIDNRSELFDALGIPKNKRKNLSDSRLILHTYRKWGQDCPLHLIGDYAFVIWDERQKHLFCARDHIGVVPFYYNLTSKRFIFANDIKAVLAVPEVSDELDEEYVIASIANKHFYETERTYFSSIRRLPPGHTLTITKDSERLERYWFPENLPKIHFNNNEDYADAARDLLTEAVNDRLRTDKQVGVHISGGLDSSGIAVLASRNRREQGLTPPEAFVWQPPPEDYDDLDREFTQIESVCKQENLTPTYCPATAEDFFELLKKDITIEPISSTMRLERTIQKEAARRGVNLILSGWGGDEVLSFNGRGFHSELLLNGRFLQLFRESKKRKSALGFLAYEFLLLFFSDRDEGTKKLQNRSFKDQKYVSPYLRTDLKDKVTLRRIPCRQTSVRSTMLWLWSMGHLAERMESWATLGSPLNIKYTYPLLDRRLMEFTIGLPRDQFIKNGWRRWIMRKTIEDFVPYEVAWQPDKDEPARIESSKATVRRVLEMARKEISSNNRTFSRAKYIDIEKLSNMLLPENLAKSPKTGDILRALQFLDF